MVRLDANTLIGDAGYDAAAFYLFCVERGLTPIVPLARTLPPDPAVERAADGTTPVCVGGIPLKRHDQQGMTINWRCAAVRNIVQKVDGQRKTRWTFDPAACPLGSPCTPMQNSWFVRLDVEENPRRNLPLSRDSDAWKDLYKQRTSVERVFSHQHQRVPDRTYRRLYLWQFACAMHALSLQAAALARRDATALAEFWTAIGMPPARTKSQTKSAA